LHWAWSEGALGSGVQVELAPGHRYAAWVPPSGGHYAYAEFDARDAHVTLVSQPGGTIRGQVVGPVSSPERTRLTLVDDRGRQVRLSQLQPGGRFEIAGLPQATWTLTAVCARRDQLLVARGTARTGESVDLRLSAGSLETR
jgi:hypothetical protein